MRQQREPSPSESLFWPVVWAVALHVLMFAMLFVSFAFAPDLPPARPIVQATLYQLKSQSQATTQTNQKIAGETKKTTAPIYETEQLEQKKADQEKQQVAAKAAEQKKAEEARKAEAAKKADAAAKAAEQKKLAETHGDQVAGSLDDLIVKLVSEQWRRPPSARNGMSVEVLIEMLPDGTIINASVTRSSGDGPFDSSAVQAVRNVGRIAEMQQLDRATFDSMYRQRGVIFKPEDLGL